MLGELETLIAAHPYRERLRRQLMLALYRCDRQADALQAYQDARRTLVEELGIEPGERLRELEAAILAQAPALAAPAPRRADPAPPAPPAPAGAPAARRPMTIVVAGLAGAPALAERLDPEAMHALLDRVAEACGAVIERHGGRVQEFAGDAILGVFGQERVREDDALRAVRAAVELRAACAALEQEHGVRLGVKAGAEAGEAFVAAGARRAPFAAGGAFGAAARLERAAAAGELLLGDALEQLVRGAVRAERTEPEGWRLLALDAGGQAIARSAGTPFVGRAPELAALRAAFDRAREARGCVVATVVGPAGMGKSRLAHEFAAGLGEAATVLTGRCPSYGDGVTYRPLAEIVGRLGAGEPRERIGALLGGDGRNRDNAVKLIQFLASHKAQQIYAEKNYEYPIEPGLEPSEMVKSFGELKADTLPLADIASHRKRLRRWWIGWASTTARQLSNNQLRANAGHRVSSS